MLHIVETRRSVGDVEKAFPEIAARHKFGVLGVHDLKGKMKEKGIPFENECLVFEVCNPQQAKKILEADMAVSTALPCRVSVYEEGGRTKIATIRPTVLLGFFEGKAPRAAAEEVEQTLLEIMGELAGPS